MHKKVIASSRGHRRRCGGFGEAGAVVILLRVERADRLGAKHQRRRGHPLSQRERERVRERGKEVLARR